MAGRSVSKIPFPSKDPRYMKVWMRLKKGDTLEEALADIDITRPPARKKKQAGSSPSPPPRDGKVNGEDLLNHPDVPDVVKDKIRTAQGDPLAPGEPTTKGKSPGTIKTLQHGDSMSLDRHSDKITIPLSLEIQGSWSAQAGGPGPVDLSPLLTAIDQVNTHLAEASGKIAPAPDLTPVLEALAENTKKLDKIAIILGTISRETTRTADKIDPPPKGSTGHVNLDLHGPIIPPIEKPRTYAKQIRPEKGVMFHGPVEVYGMKGELIRVKDLSDRESKPQWMEARNFEIEKAEALAA